MAQTVIEKIVQSHAVNLTAGHEVRAGDYVTLVPDHVMTHDNTSAVMGKFKGLGVAKVHDPMQPIFTLDHNIQDQGEENQAKYRSIAEFAVKHGVRHYPAGRGIGHQVMVEEGYVKPGGFCVASDSHSNTYGALAALGTPVVRTDAAALWATGTVWWQVPRTIRVVLEGELRPGVTGKDLIITLCGMYNQGEVLNAVLEFAGPGVASLSMEERLTVANMTTEWGALAGWFPCDATCLAFMKERRDWLALNGVTDRISADELAAWEAAPPASDQGAAYAAEVTVDLGAVTPHVAGPHSVQVMTSLADMAAQKKTIHKAYLLSCTNARLNDLTEAADVIEGKKVADHVEMYVSAASAPIQKQAEENGAWQKLLDAGARPLPPGCGPCIGLGVGLLEDGQVGISATNRNFKGRMGSRDAEAYLASPAVVAASAMAGHIAGPAAWDLDGAVPARALEEFDVKREAPPVEILDGFPTAHEGRALFLPTDNLTPEMMAKVVMDNYDPEFAGQVQAGDVVVSGYNFGTGSSREQAATSLQAAGIRCVVAGSYSQTYLRNAINNGFVCVECPGLSDAMRAAFAAEEKAGAKTVIGDDALQLDFQRSVATWRGTEYGFAPLGQPVQELVIAGGVENMVREKLG